MAGRTKAAAKPVEPEEEEFPQGHYMDKEPSEVHDNFVDWVGDEVGYEADPKTVQLVIALWQKWQKTPEQQAYNKAKKEASAEKAAAAETRKAAAATGDTAPVRRGRKPAAAAAAEPDDEPAAPRAGRARRGQIAAPVPIKRSSRRRGAAEAID